MKHTNEIKIAVFVLSGLFLLIFGWAYLREVTIQKQTKFTVVYDDVAGLARGSFIHVNGLRVGRIDSLTLDPIKKQVLVDARIQLPNIDIPKDSKLIIRTSGYVGDKYLEIVLGDSKEYIADGDVIKGEAVFDSFKSLDRISEVVNQLDPETLGKSIQEITTGAAQLVKTADEVATNTNVVVKNLPTGKELTDLVVTAHNTAEKLNSSIKKASNIADKAEYIVTDDKAQRNLSKLLSQAKEVSGDLNGAINNANGIANNEEAFENVNNILARATRIIEQIDEIKADPLVQNDLKDVLDNTNDAAKSIVATSEDVMSALHQRFLFPKLFFGKILPGKKDKVRK